MSLRYNKNSHQPTAIQINSNILESKNPSIHSFHRNKSQKSQITEITEMTEIAEKACVYASLILADEKIDITADKLSTLIAAAIWPTIIAKALEGKSVQDMVMNVGSASAAAAPAAGGAPAAAGGAVDAKEDAGKGGKKKEEEKEESDDDMGFGLFD
jgi:large subunit ribosomal protein LP1